MQCVTTHYTNAGSGGEANHNDFVVKQVTEAADHEAGGGDCRLALFALCGSLHLSCSRGCEKISQLATTTTGHANLQSPINQFKDLSNYLCN